MKYTKKVSVIMPVYNESNYIGDCIESLLKQDYAFDDMEWIFVDGMSQDDTAMILEEYRQKYPDLIRVYQNPNRTVPYAMNIGIKESNGEYIVRLDAHASYNTDYISKCVHYLETIDADNVGGTIETKGKSKTGKTIAKMLSSPFGVGNSKFRTSNESGYVDTVPFGAFRREVFEKYGLYDERLTRNEDNELNYRIRKNGGKIYLANDINLTYYCRDSVNGIAQMGKSNGKWNIITMYLCPGSMGIRHFIPLAFVLSLIILPLLGLLHKAGFILLALELAAYFSLDIIFSMKLSKNIKEIVLLVILFPTFHIFYGCGSLLGIANLNKFKK